jgi:hypothetical protein
MSDDELAWRQGLKKGDKVFVRNYRSVGGIPAEATVDRRTRTQIIVLGVRYWVKDGNAVGGSWMCIDEPTAEYQAEVADEVARRDATRTIRDAALARLPTAALVAAAKIITDATPKKDA